MTKSTSSKRKKNRPPSAFASKSRKNYNPDSVQSLNQNTGLFSGPGENKEGGIALVSKVTQRQHCCNDPVHVLSCGAFVNRLFTFGRLLLLVKARAIDCRA